MLNKIKHIVKYILFSPMATFHKLIGIDGPYSELISFYHHFPFGPIFKDKSASFRYQGRVVTFSYRGYILAKRVDIL